MGKTKPNPLPSAGGNGGAAAALKIHLPTDKSEGRMRRERTEHSFYQIGRRGRRRPNHLQERRLRERLERDFVTSSERARGSSFVAFPRCNDAAAPKPEWRNFHSAIAVPLRLRKPHCIQAKIYPAQHFLQIGFVATHLLFC